MRTRLLIAEDERSIAEFVKPSIVEMGARPVVENEIMTEQQAIPEAAAPNLLAKNTSKRERPAEIVVRRIQAFCDLTEEEAQLVRASGAQLHSYPAGQILQHEEELTGAPKFILSGWACHFRTLADGRRQIFGFLLPGDGMLMHARRRPARSSIQALTKVVTADARGFVEAARQGEKYVGLECALDHFEEERGVIKYNQIVRIGKLTAYERVANLIMELHFRLSRVGLSSKSSIPFPLTQENLADALGLSAVHIHRTIKQLRADGLVRIKGGVAYLSNLESLAAVAGFRPPRPFGFAVGER